MQHSESEGLTGCKSQALCGQALCSMHGVIPPVHLRPSYSCSGSLGFSALLLMYPGPSLQYTYSSPRPLSSWYPVYTLSWIYWCLVFVSSPKNLPESPCNLLSQTVKSFISQPLYLRLWKHPMNFTVTSIDYWSGSSPSEIDSVKTELKLKAAFCKLSPSF